MADKADDFLKDYQRLAQQAWGDWVEHFQTHPPASSGPQASAGAAPEDLFSHGLSGLKNYFDWLKNTAESVSGAAASGAPSAEWLEQLKQSFGQMPPSPGAPFADKGPTTPADFVALWRSWLQGVAQGAEGELPTWAPLGLSREQQLRQQALAEAMRKYTEIAARHQALLQQANLQAVERLQEKLAAHEQLDRTVDSLKALYDLWVETAEESYAQIVLTPEYREVYGELTNAQMRVRELQQKTVEQASIELGIPTRAEVDTMAQRIQEIRRALRAQQAREESEEITALRAEVAALKRLLKQGGSAAKKTQASRKKAAPASRQATTRKKAAPAPRQTAARKTGTPRKAATKTPRGTPRKRT